MSEPEERKFTDFIELWDDLTKFVKEHPEHQVLCSDAPPCLGWTAFRMDPDNEQAVIWKIELSDVRDSIKRKGDSALWEKVRTTKGRRDFLAALRYDDSDLEQRTREDLLSEVKRLRAGIRQDRDATGHDLCWYRPELWGLLPEGVAAMPSVPPWPEFMSKCAEFRASLDKVR